MERLVVIVRRFFGVYNYFALNMRKIITIDGPAGSGKSTVALQLARRLGVGLLDTGAMYRAVTLAAVRQEIDFDDAGALANLARQCHIELGLGGNADQVRLNGEDVTEAIRTPEITKLAYKIAQVESVREILVAQQRQIAAQSDGMVTEGRDQGTVAFSGADIKFYLDATPPCRARRRWQQYQEAKTNANLSYEEILSAQQHRDQRDAGRSISPLKVPQGAIIVDTTEMTIEQVVEKLYRYVKEYFRTFS